MTGPVPRSRLSRATVVDMAATIADTEGLDAVSLSRIAVDAGVKQPALYRHVSGIDDLLVQLSLRARRLLAAGLSEAIGSLRRDDAVLAVAHAWRNFVREHPGLYAATDRVPSVGDPKVEQSLTNVVSALTSALDGYALSAAQRAHCARSLRSSLHGFSVLERDGGHPEPFALDRSLVALVDLFCRGIASLERGK